MQVAMVKAFLDLMQTYQTLQNDFQAKLKEKAVEQYKQVKPEASEEEINEVLSSGDTQLYSEALSLQTEERQATRNLTYFQQRLQDLKRVEKSITELNQLYQDLELIVTTQGDMIDQVEFFVINSEHNTNVAVENLRKAEQNKKSSRKRMCFVIIVLLLILIVAGVVVGIVVKQQTG